MRNGVNAKIIDFSHISKSSETNLTIKRANRMHSAGVYMCIARTAREIKFNSTAVKVLYPAEIDNQLYQGMYGKSNLSVFFFPMLRLAQ